LGQNGSEFVRNQVIKKLSPNAIFTYQYCTLFGFYFGHAIPTRKLKIQFHNPNPIHNTFIQAEVDVVNNTIIGVVTNILT
jgi:hypothetical protein